MTLSNAVDYSDREIINSRVFDAPRELVFRAWTEPERLGRWWGPKGFTTSTQEFDLRPGGTWRFIMHGPTGTNYPNEMVFVEISPPRRLVLDHVSHPRFRLTICFDELGGKTKVSYRQLFETSELFEKFKGVAMPGNEEHIERLAAELATMGGGCGHTMVLSRIVGAPRELVWKAWTEPGHLAKWWGPRGFTNPRCEVDLRVGGKLHIDMQGPDRTVYPMVARFVEIVPLERLVFTGSPIDANGKPIFDITNTILFHTMGPITRLEVRAVVDKVHDPIGFQYLSGQEQGWSESLYRLADLLDKRM